MRKKPGKKIATCKNCMALNSDLSCLIKREQKESVESEIDKKLGIPVDVAPVECKKKIKTYREAVKLIPKSEPFRLTMEKINDSLTKENLPPVEKQQREYLMGFQKDRNCKDKMVEGVHYILVPNGKRTRILFSLEGEVYFYKWSIVKKQKDRNY